MTLRRSHQDRREAGWILNVHKPTGKTSFAVVSYVRRLSGIRKVGHAGSLDPQANGVLLVAAGKATKRIEELMNFEKEYVGTVRFGIVTDTYDRDGKILKEYDTRRLTEPAVRESLNNFSGTIQQEPPVFSALKYRGKPLYTYARKGEPVTPEPREVTVYRIALESFHNPEAVIRVVCARGTYVRSIAHDLGKALGCGAILSGLTRERIGHYHLRDAILWENLPEKVEEAIRSGNGNT